MRHLPPELGQDGATAHEAVALTRRDFLRLTVGGLSVRCLLPSAGCHHDQGVNYATSGRPIFPDPIDDRIPLLWVETGICTGCAGSLLTVVAPPFEALVPHLHLAYQETLMDSVGTTAIARLLCLLSPGARSSSKFVLVVDGVIPVGTSSGMTTLATGPDGHEYEAQELVSGLAARAASVVALGTCASYGGIPGSAPNTGVQVSLAEVIGRTPIRVPGCPPNPSWITSTLIPLLGGQSVDLDTHGRPTAIFSRTVHERCPRRPHFAARDFAQTPGDPTRCLLRVGCKGIQARGDCPTRMWQGRSYCIKVNHPCMACTTPGFLDARPNVDGVDVGSEGQPVSPIYSALPKTP